MYGPTIPGDGIRGITEDTMTDGITATTLAGTEVSTTRGTIIRGITTRGMASTTRGTTTTIITTTADGMTHITTTTTTMYMSPKGTYTKAHETAQVLQEHALSAYLQAEHLPEEALLSQAGFHLQEEQLRLTESLPEQTGYHHLYQTQGRLSEPYAGAESAYHRARQTA